MASRSRSRSRCSYGVKKSGACKRKPGSKRSRSRSRKVKRSRSRSRFCKVKRSKSRSRSRKVKRSRSRSKSRSRKSKSKSRSRSRKGGKGGNIYCVKCRKRTVTNDLSDTCVAGKGGHSRNAETGSCAVCGGKKMRFKKGTC